MQEKEIKILFDMGALSRCHISTNPSGKGYNALFVKTKENKASICLETRPRKSSDAINTRVFKTIDSACSLIQRQIGFQSFIINL
jgi:hypothetical protein